MKATTTLESLIARLEGGEDPGAVERDAEELFRELPREELLAAEEALAARGLSVHPRLCAAHLAASAGERDSFRARLPEGHPLATMMTEHEHILGWLARLEEIVAQESLDAEARAEAGAIGERLVGAEPHHQREEQVLFPALIERGIAGPPRVMEAEHVELRQHKHAVRDLALEGGDEAKLRRTARILIAMLRDHIAKEDGVLYPMAFEVIAAEEWPALKARCDEIGYCCGRHGA